MINKKEEFIEKARAVHGDKYDYSLVDYMSSSENIRIICPKHGIIKQRPGNHLNSCGCAKCGKENYSKTRKKTKEQFIIECNKLHKGKYDYSNTIYTNCKDKIKIECKKHGVFELIADNHLRKDGCKKCKKEEDAKKSYDNFINKSKEKHGDKYDYSLVEYTLSKNKVRIICPSHGEFSQIAMNHISGLGCNKCNLQKRFDNRETTEGLVKKFKEINGDKYSYTKTIYNGCDEKVIICCKKHGQFKKTPSSHLSGSGCMKCGNEITSKKLTSNTEEFIEKAKTIHGESYDYTLVDYNHSRDKVEIVCKHHGVFKQRPVTHLKGSGCPSCSNLINVFKRSSWEKLSNTSILYLILLENEGEKFYKIGKTKNTIKTRFGKQIGCYKYSEIISHKDKSGVVFDLENELHIKYHKYKYIPKVKFSGHTECYTLDLPIEEIKQKSKWTTQ